VPSNHIARHLTMVARSTSYLGSSAFNADVHVLFCTQRRVRAQARSGERGRAENTVYLAARTHVRATHATRATTPVRPTPTPSPAAERVCRWLYVSVGRRTNKLFSRECCKRNHWETLYIFLGKRYITFLRETLYKILYRRTLLSASLHAEPPATRGG
jgi:hypothetical protein